MPVFKIKKGLNLPIRGNPSGDLIDMTSVRFVGMLGDDFPNLKPSLLVKEGDFVRKGQPVFTDRKNPSAVFTAIATGTVKAVNRGEKRKFLSLVIERGEGEAVKFDVSMPFDREKSLNLIKDSGILTSFRKLPFAVIPDITRTPDAVFVNCMDTRPNAPDMSLIYKGNEEYFALGMTLVTKLSDKTFVCCSPELKISAEGAETAVFEGIHPAGLSGTHVHFLRPVSQQKSVWTTDMQTVIDIGYLLKNGELNETKIISLSGVANPRHIKSVKGASIKDITGEAEKDTRLINGSVLYGFPVTDETAYLTSVMNQVSAVKEQTDRPFMGWLMPGRRVHSVKNIFLSKILCEKDIDFDTSVKGCVRAMVPVGIYEKVMPMDILPTHLLRALLVKDYETAEKLGCLELSEEDLSLCTYVCPGKIDYAPILRSALTEIEKEG